MGDVVDGRMIKEEEVEEDEEEKLPPMGDDDLLREIISSLHSIIFESSRIDRPLQARIGAKLEIKDGKAFEAALEDKLRITFRKRRKKKKKPVQQPMEGGVGEGVKQQEEDEFCASDEFSVTDEEEEEEEGENFYETDRENLSEWDGNDESRQPLSMMGGLLGRRLPGYRRGWTPPPPYLGRPLLPPPSPHPFAAPFWHPSPPSYGVQAGNGNGDDFDVSDDQQSHSGRSPRKMPRLERNQNPNSAAADDYSSDDTCERRPREPGSDHQHTAPRLVPRRADSPLPSSPPSGRRILGEIVLPPRDEFFDSQSDSDEEAPPPQQQSAATVYLGHHRPSPPYYPSATPSPPLGTPQSATSSPPYWMAHDENNSPSSGAAGGSTVGDTPPPPHSLFTPFSIGASPPPSITQQAERIFAGGSSSSPLTVSSSPTVSSIVFDDPDDPDLQNLSDLENDE